MSGNAKNISLENFTFDGNKFRQDKNSNLLVVHVQAIFDLLV